MHHQWERACPRKGRHCQHHPPIQPRL